MRRINKVSLATLLLAFIGFEGFSQSDDCSTAVSITPNLTYFNYQAGSSANASQSLTTCSGGGNADDDVWYEFVANSTEMAIKVDPTVGYDAVIQLFSGTCGALTSIQCEDINGLNGAESLTASGLTIGDTYKFRVYHYGSGSGTSTFSVCVTGLAPATNNEPCSAYVLPDVTPSCNYLTFTNEGSAGSSVATPYTCGGSSPYQGGYAGGDVWFKVVVPASGQLDIHTQAIDFTDGAMALYSGNCGSLTQVDCDDDGEPGDYILMPHIFATGLTAGDTMFVRVWEYGNDNNGEFGICVTTPDNDDCANAQQICDLNGYGGVTSSAYTVDSPDNMCGIGDPSSPTAGCVFGTGYTGASPVQLDNNSWLKFVASSTTAELFVEISSCQNGNGMQMQIFEGSNCANFTPVSNFLETTSSQTVVASGLTVGNTYYIVVDGFAGDICSYTISATSGVQVAEAVATSEIICDGESVDIEGTVYGTGTYTYSWTADKGGFTSTSNPISVTPTESTEYTLEVNGYCGTTTTASVYITVNENPTANAGSDITICDNENGTITANATGGTGVYTYTWDNGLGNGNPQTVSPNTTTTYTVTATDENGCSNQDDVIVNVNAAPTANAGIDQTICEGVTANLTASGGTSYSWSSGSTVATESVSPTTTTTYTVTVGNAAGCSDTDEVIVNVNALPTAFAGNDLTVCNGGSTTITATGAGSGGSYFWSGGLGTGASHTLTNVTSDVTYTVTVTDANGCESTDDITVNVGAALTPDAGLDVSICEGESTTLSASGGTTYSWDNGVSTSSQVVSPTSTTTYIVDVTDGGSCSGQDQVTVTVNSNPTADAGIDQVICEGESANLLASGGVTYSWDNGLGSSASQSVSPTNTTTYTVTVYNAENCSDTDDLVVTVNALPAILASQDVVMCEGESVELTASGTGIVTYTWTNPDLSTTTGQSQTIIPSSTDWYYVSGTNSNNCSVMDSILVSVNPNPSIDLSTAQITEASCTMGGTISGIIASSNSDLTYQWDNGLNVIANTLSVGNLDSGVYTLTVTDENDCSTEADVTVDYNDISTVAAHPDSTETTLVTLVSLDVYANDTGNVSTINIINQASNGYVSYAGNGVFEYTPNPGFIGEDSFSYVICDLSCTSTCDTAEVIIKVDGKGEIVVPNGFSPNGDGYNDYFVILNLEQYPNNSIVIFNRWGDQVYEASPYNNDWDGSSAEAKLVVNGDQVVDGTYYFILDLGEDDTEKINGFIDLRRE